MANDTSVTYLAASWHEMSDRFTSLFTGPKPLIGMVPLLPLPGYAEHPGRDALIEAALADLDALQRAGFDAALVENDNDQPHQIGVTTEIREAFAVVMTQLVGASRIPIGMEIIYDMEATVTVAHEV